MKTFRIRLLNTIYEIEFSVKITRRVPKYATVMKDTTWVYAGHRFKVVGVYAENSRFTPELGRQLKLSLVGTAFEGRHLGNYTVIYEKDLILEY